MRLDPSYLCQSLVYVFRLMYIVFVFIVGHATYTINQFNDNILMQMRSTIPLKI